MFRFFLLMFISVALPLILRNVCFFVWAFNLVLFQSSAFHSPPKSPVHRISSLPKAKDKNYQTAKRPSFTIKFHSTNTSSYHWKNNGTQHKEAKTFTLFLWSMLLHPTQTQKHTSKTQFPSQSVLSPIKKALALNRYQRNFKNDVHILGVNHNRGQCSSRFALDSAFD